MNDHHTHGGGAIGYIIVTISWVFGFVGIATLSIIPIVLSSVASGMAIVNYYYQIKKNKQS